MDLRELATGITAVLDERDRLAGDNARLDATIRELGQTNTDMAQRLFDQNRALTLLTDENLRLKAELALLRPAPFKCYSEYRAIPDGDLPAMNRTRVLMLGNNAAQIPDGSGPDSPHDEARLRANFAAMKAANPWADMVILDDESRWTGMAISQEALPNYVTLVNIAKEFWPEVYVYGFPERYFAFLTAAGALTDPASESYARKQALFSRIAALQPLTDVVTGWCASFYYRNPVHHDVAKLRTWIQTYGEMRALFAPGKPMLGTFWPRDPDGGGGWISGAIHRAALEEAKKVCSGFVLFGRSGGKDPDPRTLSPVPDWWIEDQAFVAALTT